MKKQKQMCETLGRVEHTHTHTTIINERRLQCSFLFERWCQPLGLARGWLC